MSVLERVQALLGRDAVTAAPDAPRVAPDAIDAVALLLGTAHAEGWRVRVEGAATWLPADAPADIVLSTRRLDHVVAVAPADLTATTQAGIAMEALRRRLGESETWLALDPPGAGRRTLGSVLATATAGPLRQGFGPVRDQVLGLAVVTGDGRVVRSGGRVMKNVAGYDLTKLQVGGFGAFGVIVEAHLRLRAVPRADVTFVREGPRETLMGVAEAIRAAALQPAAFELVAPALSDRAEWCLAVRLAGAVELVAAQQTALGAAAGAGLAALDVAAAHDWWTRIAASLARAPVTLRAGTTADGTDALLDLLTHRLGDGGITAAPDTGAVRWAGDASLDALRAVRRSFAGLEVPLTLERAPWPVRRAFGHFGAYREGVGPLVAGLRRTFDPGARLVTAIEGDAGDA